MTALELLYNFNVELNTAYRMSALESDEVFYWINKAQDRFVTKRYTGYSASEKLGVEQSQKRIDDLRPLTVYSPVGLLSNNPPAIMLPQDYMHLLRVILYAEGNCINKDPQLRIKADQHITTNKIYNPIYAKYAQLDDINVLLDDPFNEPIEDYPLYIQLNNSIQVYVPNSMQLIGGRVYYIKKPSHITPHLDSTGLPLGPFTASGRIYTTTPQLADYCYVEIIDNAIQLYLKSVTGNNINATETTE